MISNKKIDVLWDVENTGASPMSLQIGGHPAIVWLGDHAKGIKGYIQFDNEGTLESMVANNDGYIVKGAEYPVATQGGILKVDDETLNGDTLLFGDSQTKSVTLLSQEKEPFFRMNFESPVLAIWAPDKKDCPFVCLEPWYGLCDPVGYTGEFRDRKYTNTIEAGKTFRASYSMEVLA